MRCSPSMRMSPTVNGPCTVCACTFESRNWTASATSNPARNSSRTRRPDAISVASAQREAPLLRLKLRIDHDFPLIQMSCNIVIEGEAHQYHQQRYPDFLTEDLRALRQRAALDGFGQLIRDLAAVQQRH